MAETVVEIHVPLTPTRDLGEGEYEFPWIDTIEQFLAELEADDRFEGAMLHGDGEEVGEHYVFFVSGASERMLLQAATAVVQLSGVPTGAFAVISDSDAGEFGLGDRVELG